MPVVSRELDGARFYTLAFAGPLATGVVGMVTAGDWSDRRGPASALATAVGLFLIGLLIGGTATSMPIFIMGRLIQGLGGGAITVALYVVVAKAYPAELHAKVFAAFAAAWVIPSVVGPFVAGLVAQSLSWHWVFLGVVGLVIPAQALVTPSLRGLRRRCQEPAPVPWSIRRLSWALVAALAVLGLNLAPEVQTGNVAIVTVLLATAAATVALLAVRPLLPPGTLVARRGLPSVILARGTSSAAFFGTEVFLPYLLTEQYRFTPSSAGIALTGAALTWALASAVQGRLGARLNHRRAVSIGFLLVLLAIVVVLAATVFFWVPAVVIAGWLLAGAGMGLQFPRLTVMTLALSRGDEQGFNSSALSISHSLGAALALSVTGLVFTAFSSSAASFAGVFIVTAMIAASGVAVSFRIRDSSNLVPATSP